MINGKVKESDDLFSSCIHNIDKSRGFIVCTKCGYVFSDKVFQQSVVYRRKTDGKSFFSQNSIKQPISSSRTVFKISDVPYRKVNLFKRLNRLNNFLQKTDSLYNISCDIMKRFDDICNKYGLSLYIRNEAILNFIKIRKNGLIIGRTMNLFILVIFYIICRRENFQHYLEIEKETEISPLFSLKEISKIENVSFNRLHRYLNLVCETLDIKVTRLSVEYRLYEVSKELIRNGYVPSDFYKTLFKYIDKIKEACNLPSFKRIDPIRIIGVFIYYNRKKIGANKIRQCHLSKITKISEVTLRKYVKILLQSRLL